MKLTKQTEAELLKAYYNFWEANLSADMEKFSSYLVDDFSIIGSANGEVFFSRQDAVKFYTATAEEMRGKAELRNRKVSTQPLDTKSAIVREESDLYVLIGKDWTFYGHARISCVITNIDGAWKAVHQHASFADHRTEEGQQLASEKIEKENLELREAVKRRTVELESKNRDLEIEAALERVRARTMAMQHSNELSDVVYVLYKQMQQLGFDYGACTITLMNAATGDTDWWMAGFSDLEYPDCYHVNYFDHPGYKAVLTAWKQKEKFAAIEIKGASKRAYDNIIFTQTGFSKLADHIKTMMASLDSVIYSMAYMKYGALSFGPTAITDSQKHILQKFTEVFEQTYTRFLDLQKAEAQAREAEIELALERVRARTMAMQESEDLKSVVKELYEQLRQLGFKWGAASITIMDEATGDFDWWLEGFEDGYELPERYHVPYFNHKGHNQQLEQWKAGSNYAVIEISGADKKSYDNYYFFQTDFSRAPDRSKNLMMSQEAVIFSMAYTRYGALSWSPTKLDDQQAIVLQRMAKVFEQTYTRFLDLQKAEAQAREAKIEAALERVRSTSLAMHKSQDLGTVVYVVFSELVKLDAQLDRCLILTVNPQTLGITWYLAGKEGLLSNNGFLVPDNPQPSHQAYLNGWRTKRKKWQYLLGGEEKRQCDAYVFSQTELCHLPDFIKADMAAVEAIHLTISSDDFGCLVASSLAPLSDAHAGIVERFAVVFNQAYTRFLDLQKAEAQALRAEQDLIEIKLARKKAEDTLTELQLTQKQLIQSEKMASLGELTAGIAHEIQNPLNFVNNFSEVSTELVEEMKAELATGNQQQAAEIANDLKQNLEKINHHGKRAGDIVKGMLQHSRTSTGQKELTDINALCDEYLRLSYHGLRAKDKSFNAKFETDFDSSLPKINVVPQEMGRVILNLINNAFYAVNEKAKQLPENYEPTVTVSTRKELNKAIIIVADNGDGIPTTIKDKIFQPFFTTKPTGQGTGLGLSLSYDIVKAHGGELKVEPKEREGSKFVVILPTRI